MRLRGSQNAAPKAHIGARRRANGLKARRHTTCTGDAKTAQGDAEGDSIGNFIQQLAFDERTGLVTAIAQDIDTGALQMQAFADRAAVRHTLESGNATFFSRSRNNLWVKGESSGNTIRVHSVHVDCDSDSLVYLGMYCAYLAACISVKLQEGWSET